MENIVPVNAKQNLNLKVSLYIVISVVRKFGDPRLSWSDRKAENFSVINLVKLYGGIDFILGLIIRFGKEDGKYIERFFQNQKRL